MKNILIILVSLITLNCCITKTSYEPEKHTTIYDDDLYDTAAISLICQAVEIYKSINSYDQCNNSVQLLRTCLVLIDSSLSIDDSYPTGYYFKIRLLSKLKLQDSALKIFDEASIKYPENPYIYFAKGVVQERNYDHEAAIKSFKKSFILFQESPLSSIQFNFESKELAYFLCYGREKALFRVDSIIRTKKDVFYDKKFARIIKKFNKETYIKKW